MIGIPGDPGRPAGHGEPGVGMVGVRHRAGPRQRDAAGGDRRSPASCAVGGRAARDGARPGDPGHPQGRTYLIWSGQRTQIDPADRSVTFNLGLDPGATGPIQISNALFDAMPSTEPLVVPVIPEAGTPSRWLPESVGGQRAGNHGCQRRGQRLLRAAARRRPEDHRVRRRSVAHRRQPGIDDAQLVSPDKLVDIPEVAVLNVDFYPTGKLEFVDTAANPVDLRRLEEADHRPAGQR